MLFKHAKARGLCDRNPAADTLKRDVEKQTQRLTLDAFHAIHAAAPTWLKNAMDLGLKTLQRRGDLLALKWEQVREGYIWIQQQKVEKYESGNLKILITGEIENILNHCRDEIESQYVIHRRPEKRRHAQGRDDITAVTPRFLSQAFMNARDASRFYSASASPSTLPGFHEIRSLGAVLYEDAGTPTKTIQALLGHTSEKMTEHYLKGHKIRWSEVNL